MSLELAFYSLFLLDRVLNNSGHELYLNAVESLRLYSVTQRMRPLAHLDAEEMCLVTEVCSFF